MSAMNLNWSEDGWEWGFDVTMNEREADRRSVLHSRSSLSGKVRRGTLLRYDRISYSIDRVGVRRNRQTVRAKPWRVVVMAGWRYGLGERDALSNAFMHDALDRFALRLSFRTNVLGSCSCCRFIFTISGLLEGAAHVTLQHVDEQYAKMSQNTSRCGVQIEPGSSDFDKRTH